MTCMTIPITVILGGVFFTLWFLSPQSAHLRFYQHDVYVWNTEGIRDKMAKLQF